MTTTTAPSDLIVKFDTTTDTTTLPTIGSSTLASGATGILFNLQIVEKPAEDPLAAGSIGSTVIGSAAGQINTTTSLDLANLITQYFADKSILSIPASAGAAGRNIRSMKLIVNVDPTA